MTVDPNVALCLKNLGYQHNASSLAGAVFASMVELSLITAKALKDANAVYVARYIVNDYNNWSVWWHTLGRDRLAGMLNNLLHQLQKSGMSGVFFSA